uniref:Zgc:92275 n=1 Tax=Fundulus heteroclitus TaxID=8078 RepID=A0A3Q2QRF3_FUNHE
MSTYAALSVGLGLGAVLLTLDSGVFHLRWEFPALRGAAERIALCVTAGVTVLALGWLYRLLFSPLELLRTPDEVGYIAEDGRAMARAANEARRRRKVGELPPVYPNGWYRVLDSHMLARGEVKNVYILGMYRGSDGKCEKIPYEIPENGADIAHLGHLHTPGILSGVDLRYTNSKTWDFVRHDWKVEWEPEPEPNSHCSQMLVNHSLTVFGCHWPLLDLHVVARQVGPGVVFLKFDHSFLGRGIMMHCVTPVEPLLQCVTHTMFYQANIPAVVPKFILKAESIQFERDVMIWNNKKYIPKPLLVKEDSAVRRHRRWYSQFYSENSPRLQYQRDTLDF